MTLKTYSPFTPSRRNMTGYGFEEITKDKPEKSLVVTLKNHAGRNNSGRITIHHRGGGSKRKYRIIDFKRSKLGVPGKVSAIEYDPNRTARIALIEYEDGEKRYILAPVDLKVGDPIMSGEGSDPKIGNCLPLRNIPVGTAIHNVELQPGRGGQIVRTAGGAAQLLTKEGDYATIRLPSGELRKVMLRCMATIGQIGNIDHQNIILGKAGRNRNMGWRPTVRGTVRTPRDHPHGGGESHCPRGMPPKTPWGKPALGKKTRRNKVSDKFIVKRRK